MLTSLFLRAGLYIKKRNLGKYCDIKLCMYMHVYRLVIKGRATYSSADVFSSIDSKLINNGT